MTQDNSDRSIDFNVRHSTYVRYYKRWETAYDFKRGGLHVLEPGHDVDPVSWKELVRPRDDGMAASADGAEPEPAIPSSRFDARSGHSQSYLFKHARETFNQFNERHRRQYNYPLFQYIVNVCTSGVLRHEPQRDGVTGIWEQIHADFDMAGTSINAHERMTMALALTFGRMHTLIDRPLLRKRPRNRMEQRRIGERAHGYSVTPLDLVDWSMDRNGNFIWATIMEPLPDARLPGSNVEGRGVQYRVWYVDRWELWTPIDDKAARRDRNKFKLTDSGKHPCGRVPLATLWATKLNESTSMAIESPLADHLDMNRSILNDASEANESERSQTFALLAIPVQDGETLGALDISHWSAMSYNAGAGAVTYVSPDAALPTGKMDRIREKLNLSRQLAAVSRGKAELSKEERSAEAIALESEDKRNQLTVWAQALAEYNREVHEIIAAWEDESTMPTAVYNMDFDTKAVSGGINDAVQLSSIPIVRTSAAVQAAITRPLVRRIMTDAGDDKPTIETALMALTSASTEDQSSDPA